MKFILGAAGLEPAKEGGSFILDQYNKLSDKVISAEMEAIFKPIGEFIQQAAIYSWHWFIVNLPDIIGYTTIGAGILIIISAMAGKGVIKPLAWYFAAFILAACILGSV